MPERIRMLLAVQQDAFSKQQIARIENRSRHLYKRYFGDQFRITPVWLMIPAGNAYIAGKPSTGSTITLSVTNGTDNETRHAFMSEFSSMWMKVTGCKRNELVLTVMDQQFSDHYSQRNLNRIDPVRRLIVLPTLMGRLAVSKVVNGFLSMNLNIHR